MVSVVVVASSIPAVVECGDEVVTSQAGIKASLAVPLWPVPLLDAAEAVELSSVRWEADSVVRANLAVVVPLLALALAPAAAAPGRGLVVPFLVGVGSRDALRAPLPLPPAAAPDDDAGRLGASLGRMGRRRTHTWMLALREEDDEEVEVVAPSCPPRRGLSGVPNIGAPDADAVAVVIAVKYS